MNAREWFYTILGAIILIVGVITLVYMIWNGWKITFHSGGVDFTIECYSLKRFFKKE